MKWCVVSYQIPVPEGDCSIHVRHCDKKHAIAIIMDGGKGKKSIDSIKQAWKLVNDDLLIDGLKLSSWIVTHWDQDHHQGALAWLENNAKEVLVDFK
jgi:glyoxylase-like metal-dependent hydrolase (beta-lactamase superfamily II)